MPDINELLKQIANIAFVIGLCLTITFAFLWRYFDKNNKLSSKKACLALIIVTNFIVASFAVGMGIWIYV